MQPDVLFVLLLAAAASSVGGLLLCLRRWSEESLFAMISASGGLLLAITLLDLLPHSIGGDHHDLTPFVLLGFAAMFVLEQIGHSGRSVGATSVIGVLSGFLLHAYVEGVSLIASFRLDSTLGLSVLLALLLHKIPDGVTVASLLLAATKSRVKAFFGASALGVATLVGASSVELVETMLPPIWSPVMIAVTTGVFLYVSASHLVPLIQHAKRAQLGVYFFAAMLAYMLITTFLHGKLHVHV
jgi:zinc transporter ZupT